MAVGTTICDIMRLLAKRDLSLTNRMMYQGPGPFGPVGVHMQGRSITRIFVFDHTQYPMLCLHAQGRHLVMAVQ